MPTSVGQIVNNQILLPVHIRLPVRPGDPDPLDAGSLDSDLAVPQAFTGLLDTGATRTMVSPAVIEALDAYPCGIGSFTPATGMAEPTGEYRLDLAIPIVAGVTPTEDDANTLNVEFYARGLRDVTVLGLPCAFDDFDVLLGMDLISQFHITMFQDLYMLSN